MLHQEKEMNGHNNATEGDEEIVLVDKAIEEKEDILNKLMDSVKV